MAFSFPVDNWFKAPKLPVPAKGKPTKPAVSLPYPGYQTPAQIAAQASAQAQAGLAPSIAAIKQLQADEQARAAQRAALIQSLYAQLAALQKNAGPQTQAIYTTAANTQTGFAKGFSDGLQHALNGNTDAINQTLSSIGAPAGQQVTSPAEPAGNVLYGLGGMLPGTVLNREGAAFGSAAALLPGATFGRGMIDVQQLLNASADTQKQYGEKLAELEAGLPADIQKITAGLQAAQAKLEATNYSRKKDQRDYAFKVWQANTKLKTDAAKTSFDQWYKKQQLAMRANGQNFQQWATQQRLGLAQAAQDSTNAYRQAQLQLGQGRLSLAQQKALNGKPASAATIKAGFAAVKQSKQGWWALQTNAQRPLLTSELRAILGDYNRAHKNDTNFVPLTLADLNHLSAAEQDQIGIQYSYGTPQETYLNLIHSGIPARRAWQMVRTEYKNWGKDYFGGKRGPVNKFSPVGGKLFNMQAKIIGYPYQGSHTMYGNWESDNAIDLAVPDDTPIYAPADGKIGSQLGFLPGANSDPHLEGQRLHLVTNGNEYYLAHLSRIVVTPGESVRRGQLIGYSGSANGTAHLHIGVRRGNPVRLFRSSY